MKKQLLIILSTLLFLPSFTLLATELAIQNTADIKESLDENDSYWEFDLGISTEFSKSHIVGLNHNEKGDLSASVFLSGGYYYRDFFIEVNPFKGRTLTAGYSLQRTKKFVLNIIAESLFQGFEQTDQNSGNQLDGINARKISLDGGIEAHYSYKYGEARFRALTDISNTHEGYVVAFDYAYPIFMKRWTIWPSYGISWLSADTVKYYFGVEDNEVRTNRPFYQPGSAFTHKMNLYVAYQYNTHLSFVGYSDYILYSKNINNSPLVKTSNDSFRVGMGVTWSF